MSRYRAIDAVIWDYDGTLVATRFADKRAVEELLQQEPSLITGLDRFWAAEGQPIVNRLELAWPGRSHELLPHFSAHVDPIRFRGILSVLREMRRAGLSLAVVSSRQRQALERGLEVSKLRPFFSSVIGLDDVTQPKPSPEGLEMTLERLDVAPERARYVGDSDVDILAGRAAQVLTYHATWAIQGEYTTVGSALELKTPRDVLQVLGLTGSRAPTPDEVLNQQSA